MMQLAIFLHLPIKFPVVKSIFKHFCGGETLPDCENTINSLQQYQVKTILDYSAEGGATEAELDEVANEIRRLIEYAATNDAIPFAVFKPSGIMRPGLLMKVAASQMLSVVEKLEFELDRKRFMDLCDKSAAKNLPLFVDAEETWIQKPVDDLMLEMMRKHNKQKAIIFNTLQMYRTDRLDYLHQLTEMARNEKFYVGVKLVRGAYVEKEHQRAMKLAYPTPVFNTKIETDSAFNKAIEFCFEYSGIVSFCCASHNEFSCALLVEYMSSVNIAPNDPRFWFAQLHGMSNHISFNLAKAGFNVCKYVPYGPIKAVMPYLMRRAEENTSIAGQTGRELQLILAEQKRRSHSNP